MCGIAGYFGSKNVTESTITKTLDLMKRRGPNGQKHEKIQVSDSKYCHMLHSRLSIIDLDDRSNQPFHYNDKTLIYNGEIYNYLEVRDTLKKIGHQFKTDSDTEVLIHALDEWGTDALNIVEGMWSFALYDHKLKKLTLSRDPFGEKPLYIYQPAPGELYFASEIKFLASLSGIKFTPNYEHISRFLVNGYKSLFKNKYTFFLEVNSFSKASILEISLDGKQKTARYWHPKVSPQKDMSFNEAVKTTRELLINSVTSRLRSDIPIAFCMSGGVDSNSLISIAKRVLNYDVHGFTILNTDSRYEEQDMIDIGVSELGIKHNGYPVSPNNFIQNMKELVSYHDAPVITISFYLNWLLQQAISNHGYHISISGTAADEMFSGYFDHQILYMYDIQHDKNFLKESVANWKRETAPIVRNPFLQNATAFIDNPFSREHIYLNNDKYSSYFHKPWKEDFYETYYRDELLQNRMMNELFHETTPVSLHEDDLNAMYFSIENRSPFLDRKLYEFSQSIPAKHLIKDGRAKAVLREAMRGIVPDPILNSGRKVGFNAPISDLFKIDQEDVKSYLLQDSPIWDILNPVCMKEFIDGSNLPNSDSKFLFSFISAKLFLETFF